MRAAGGQPPRLATGELSVHPDWEAGPKGQQRPTGYRAAARLTARLDVPARAGQVATAAVTAGGEAARVHRLALVVGDQAGVLAAAREAAWRMLAVGPSSMPRWRVSRWAGSCGSRRWPVGATRCR